MTTDPKSLAARIERSVAEMGGISDAVFIGGDPSVTITRSDCDTILSALRARVPTANETLGMAWWNHLTEQERAAWLQRAGSAVAADAWAEFQRGAASEEAKGLVRDAANMNRSLSGVDRVRLAIEQSADFSYDADDVTDLLDGYDILFADVQARIDAGLPSQPDNPSAFASGWAACRDAAVAHLRDEAKAHRCACSGGDGREAGWVVAEALDTNANFLDALPINNQYKSPIPLSAYQEAESLVENWIGQGGSKWVDHIGSREAIDLCNLIAALTPPADGWRPTRWRHKKRGTEYTEIARGKIQNAFGAFLADDHEMVVYRGDDGLIWVRPTAEFEDGRFEPADAPLPYPPQDRSGQ